MGTMNVTIKGDGVDPEKGSTVYGKISCDGKASQALSYLTDLRLHALMPMAYISFLPIKS